MEILNVKNSKTYQKTQDFGNVFHSGEMAQNRPKKSKAIQTDCCLYLQEVVAAVPL